MQQTTLIDNDRSVLHVALAFRLNCKHFDADVCDNVDVHDIHVANSGVCDSDLFTAETNYETQKS